MTEVWVYLSVQAIALLGFITWLYERTEVLRQRIKNLEAQIRGDNAPAPDKEWFTAVSARWEKNRRG